MRIFLTGYMGSGKSTTGRILAESLGLDFLDLDDEFEARYHISIDDFFRKYGEKTFRLLEQKLLREQANSNNIVISTGGGTPCYSDNMEWMNRHGITVYIRVQEDELLRRLQVSSKKRPMFSMLEPGDLAENLHNHLVSREAYYLQSAIQMNGESSGTGDLEKKIKEISGLLPSAQ